MKSAAALDGPQHWNAENAMAWSKTVLGAEVSWNCLVDSEKVLWPSSDEGTILSWLSGT
jgi:hypothetical protein